MHRIDRLWQEAGETAKVLNPRFYPGIALTAFLQRVRAGREAARVCVRRAGGLPRLIWTLPLVFLKLYCPKRTLVRYYLCTWTALV